MVPQFQSVLILDPPDHSVDDLRKAFRASLPVGCPVVIATKASGLLHKLRSDPGARQ
jgi:hypothetical protein